MNGVTKAQQLALAEIAAVGDRRGGAVHADHLNCNRGMLDRLCKAGFIHSATPFAYAFHTITLTDAGRAILAKAAKP